MLVAVCSKAGGQDQGLSTIYDHVDLAGATMKTSGGKEPLIWMQFMPQGRFELTPHLQQQLHNEMLNRPRLQSHTHRRYSTRVTVAKNAIQAMKTPMEKTTREQIL